MKDLPLEEKATDEILTDRDNVPEVIKSAIIMKFKDSLKSKSTKAYFERIFNLAKSKITIGIGYWRIEPEHGTLLKKLIATYL